MAKLNRTCIICGKKYEYCGHCDNKYLVKETWRNIYCSEKCRETFRVLEQYTAKKITADEAIHQLELLGVDIKKIDKNFKKTLDSIELSRKNSEVLFTFPNDKLSKEPSFIEVKQTESTSRKKKRRKKNIVKSED